MTTQKKESVREEERETKINHEPNIYYWDLSHLCQKERATGILKTCTRSGQKKVKGIH